MGKLKRSKSLKIPVRTKKHYIILHLPALFILPRLFLELLSLANLDIPRIAQKESFGANAINISAGKQCEGSVGPHQAFNSFQSPLGMSHEFKEWKANYYLWLSFLSVQIKNIGENVCCNRKLSCLENTPPGYNDHMGAVLQVCKL